VIRVEGRIGALMEVSAGFHADLTGRENIYLQGALMGIRRIELGGSGPAFVHVVGHESSAAGTAHLGGRLVVTPINARMVVEGRS
jgi:hypothetical protein